MITLHIHCWYCITDTANTVSTAGTSGILVVLQVLLPLVVLQVLLVLLVLVALYLLQKTDISQCHHGYMYVSKGIYTNTLDTFTAVSAEWYQHT